MKAKAEHVRPMHRLLSQTHRPLLMNKLGTILLITCILLAGLAFSASAQKRPDKTASARAYYGHKDHKQDQYKKPKVKVKKNKKQKYTLRKQARKATRAYAGDRSRQKRRT